MKHKLPLTISFVLLTSLASAQNIGVGTNSPQEKLDVVGGVRVGYTTSNNGGTLRYNGSAIEYNTGFGWRSMVNNYTYAEMPTFTTFTSTTRNSFVEITGVSQTIAESGVYLVIFKTSGGNNNSYFPSGGTNDVSGILDFRVNGGSLSTTSRYFLIPQYSYTGTTNRLDFLPNPTEYSTVRQLNAGDVLKIYAEVVANGSPTGQWFINEANITTIRLY